MFGRQQFNRECDDPFELPEQLADAIAMSLRVPVPDTGD
jgi:hypothetical protein